MNDHIHKLQAAVLSDNFVILDTETTGLHIGEICQIAIVDSAGKTMLDTLVKTRESIPHGAIAVHGITDDTVRSSPDFPVLYTEIRRLLTGTNVIVYNAVYDRKMLHQSAERWQMEKTDWKALSAWHCAMETFAVIYGDWNSYHNSYRWQKLSTAASYYKIPQPTAHSALADCQTTLAVVRRMAGLDADHA